MAASSYRYVVNSLIKFFNLNYPDSNITSNQVTYWVLIASNYIRQRSLKVTMTGSFLSEFQSVPISVDSQGRKFFTLPSQILDLENEKGIDYVAYQQTNVSPFGKQIRLQQTDVNVIDRLFYSPYEKPSPSIPYFYRVGQTVFTLGIENVPIIVLQCGLYTALDTRPNLLNIDNVIGINEEQIVTLNELVEGFAKLALIVPKDRTEEGDDTRNENINTFAKATSKQQPQEQE